MSPFCWGQFPLCVHLAMFFGADNPHGNLIFQLSGSMNLTPFGGLSQNCWLRKDTSVLLLVNWGSNPFPGASNMKLEKSPRFVFLLFFV